MKRKRGLIKKTRTYKENAKHPIKANQRKWVVEAGNLNTNLKSRSDS